MDQYYTKDRLTVHVFCMRGQSEGQKHSILYRHIVQYINLLHAIESGLSVTEMMSTECLAVCCLSHMFRSNVSAQHVNFGEVQLRKKQIKHKHIKFLNSIKTFHYPYPTCCVRIS